MIDLGMWAGGEYRVPGPQVEDREHPSDREQRRSFKDNGSDDDGSDRS
jgi:endogenous inhibitor of DNA gyrase (YacG/DUF329 family)